MTGAQALPAGKRGLPERYYPAAGILFLLAFALYVATLAPGLMPGDTGDMVQTAAGLREAHPPGYPLYALLGKLFVALPIGTIPYRVNLMSAFLGGLSVALVFLCLVLLTRHVAASVAGALLFAFNTLFWTYFVLAETFGLNSFFLALTAFLALLWRERVSPSPLAPRPQLAASDAAWERGTTPAGSPSPLAPLPQLAASDAAWERGTTLAGSLTTQGPTCDREGEAPLPPSRGKGPGDEGAPGRILDLLAFVCGLSLGNHHTMVLTFPGLFLFAVAVDRSVLRPRRLLRLLGLGALGLILAYAYLPLAALFTHDHHWEDTGTLQGLVRLFLRAKYGSLQLDPRTATHVPALAQAGRYLMSLTTQFLWPGFILGLVGLAAAIRRDRPFLVYTATSFALGVGFLMHANIDPGRTAFDAATLERFYLLPNFFFLLLVGVGLGAAARGSMGVSQYGGMRVKSTMLPHSHTPTLPHSHTPRWLLAGVMLLLPALLLKSSYPRASLRGNRLYPRFLANVLDTLPAGAVLLAGTDEVALGAGYLADVERRRPDVAVVMLGLAGAEPYATAVRRHYPRLRWPPVDAGGRFRLREFLAANGGRHRIFLDDVPPGSRLPLTRYGLIYEARADGHRPDLAAVVRDNERLWQRYDLRQVNTALYAPDSTCYSITVFWYLFQRFRLARDYNRWGRHELALRHLQACRAMDGGGTVAASPDWQQEMARASEGSARR